MNILRLVICGMSEMSRMPTSFQKKCLEVLKEKLASNGIDANRIEYIKGKEENYYNGEIDHVKFWIYIDAADIVSDVFERVYEPPDYNSEDDLILRFVNDLVRAVNEPRSQEKRGKSRFWRTIISIFDRWSQRKGDRPPE